jgi:adhesin/invasin
VIFAATGSAGSAATVAKHAGDSQTASAAAAVATPPSVLVSDAYGNPVSGATVTFAASSGGGAVTGAAATSDASGIATVGGWTLGSTIGTNTVTATVAGLPPATFTATSTAAAAKKLTGDNQTATVASAVATPPAVLVQDANQGPIPGASVTFAVGSGGGKLAGGGFTEVATTDASGVATVGSWTLGTTMGTNTLTATVSRVPPLTFTATGTAGAAATLMRQGGNNQTGTAGAPVPLPVTVKVNDALGNPVSGATVTFAVSSGGGSVTGAAATTDGSGIATVGGWTLGTAAGTNTVTATSSGLPPVIFTATGSAGAAATVTKHAGDGQTAGTGSAVATPPVVSVTDAYGNSVRGAGVTFTVTSGGGSVTGGTTSTDTNGNATVGGWTLGPAAGTNTLSATVQGLPAVTFSATAIDPCVTAMAYTIGSTVDGTLGAGDCQLGGGPYAPYADLYATTVPSPSGAAFSMSSNSFYTSVSLFDGSGALVASASDACYGYYYYCDPSAGSNAGFQVLLAPGSYVVDASSSAYNAVVGDYSLSSTVAAEDVTGCAQVWITAGLTTSQQIQSTDCAASFRLQTYYSDQFTINLTAGRAYTFTMSSTAFDTYLELWQGGQIVASNDDFGGTSNSQITFKPAQSGTYVINAATYLGNQTGAYTLAIQ